MTDIKTKEGARARIHVPDGEDKKMLVFFFVGIGERGLDINKVDNYGPIFFVANPTQSPQVDWSKVMIVHPLNEVGDWGIDEVRSVFNHMLENYPNIDLQSIHFIGHSLGGGAVYKAAASPDISGKVASFTVISPLKGYNPEAIAKSAVPGRAYHARLDAVTKFADTENLVNQINYFAKRSLWSLIAWDGYSHSSTGKVLKDPTYFQWLKDCRSPGDEEIVISSSIINGNELHVKTESGSYKISGAVKVS